ncbi:hypothetical protein ACFW9O_17675 [Streptomyces sp. NPDC059499]|uniref:hypothetical protein n=1 Tax=Streptomyces sp. NPDC059499 TaxID=3346852 RepID=UPI0036CCAAB5
MSEQRATMTDDEMIHHLLTRSFDGVILHGEQDHLRELVRQLQAERDTARARHAVPDRTTLPDLHHRIVDALATAYPDPPFDAADLGHLVLAVRDSHVEQLEQQVAALTAGQCTHALAMCEQHHTTPVDGCPYPRCIAARKRETERQPDFTSPLTGIEVRNPCPYCGDHQLIPRHRMAEHIARLHPDERRPATA